MPVKPHTGRPLRSKDWRIGSVVLNKSRKPIKAGLRSTIRQIEEDLAKNFSCSPGLKKDAFIRL